MRDYLEGYHFTVLTDDLSLKWLGQMDNPSGRLARWAMELSQWDFTIKTNNYMRNFEPERLVPPPNEDRRRRS